MLHHLFSSYRTIDKNRPTGKFCQDDEALRLRGTLGIINRTIIKGERIRARRGADDFWHHSFVKRDHPAGIGGNIQRRHQGVATSIHWSEDMGKIQYLISPSQRAKESGNNRRERGYPAAVQNVYGVSPTPPRRASWGDWPRHKNIPRNAYEEPRTGGTGTSQYSPHQLKHDSNGKIGTDDCDHELHAGKTQDASSGTN